LDWKKFAGTILYCSASSKCSDVGTALAYILIQLVANKLINPSDVHLIGHSLGAHVIGNCGNVFFELMKKKVARITGMCNTINQGHIWRGSRVSGPPPPKCLQYFTNFQNTYLFLIPT
jgi:hypothetical protein